MAVDVSPEILEEIEKNFEEYYKDPNVKRIYKKIVDGTATYSDMQILSGLVAKHIYQSTEKAYTNALESGKLPNDKLYQNIVDKTMRPTLKDGHGLIVEACGDVQTDLNRKSGIKLNAVEPELNESKVSGLIYQITNTNETKLSRTVLSGLIDTFCRSVVDDFVHANLDFQKESGLSPQISRTRGTNSNSKCAYCAALVYTGKYKGPSMPEEIFRRHRYCHCNVLYNPMNGKKLQDVWSKREYQDYREAEQKQRQYLAELDRMTPTERRLARNARARELRRAKYSPEEWQRRKAMQTEIANARKSSEGVEYEGIPKAWKSGGVTTTDEALKGANPHYKKNIDKHLRGTKYDYSTNCTNAVVAFDMRRRGYNVTACSTGENRRLRSKPFSAWRGRLPKKTTGSGLEDILRFMDTAEETTRIVITVNFPSHPYLGRPPGHAFIAEKVNGKTVFLDPQKNQVIDESFFDRVEKNSTMYMKVDDLEISDRGISACKGVK